MYYFKNSNSNFSWPTGWSLIVSQERKAYHKHEYFLLIWNAMKLFYFYLIINIFILNGFLSQLKAQEYCGRTATVNFQKVLIDTNSNEKGEGLRFLLEKDPQAKELLAKYQEGTKIKWYNAITGTIGTGLVIAGSLTNGQNGNNKKLIIGGLSLILINFMTSMTSSRQNEQLLEKAVDQYNQRNLPQIEIDSAATPSLNQRIIDSRMANISQRQTTNQRLSGMFPLALGITITF